MILSFSTRLAAITAAALGVAALGAAANAQSLPSGDLVIINTSNTPADAATGNGHYESVQLQAYNVSGPTPMLDATVPLTGLTMLTGIDDDRHLNLSVNGQLITTVGYNAAQAAAGTVAPGPVGDDSLYAASAASVNRMIASVNAAGQATYINLNQNASGAIVNSAGANLYDTSEITSAITVNGSQYYVTGEPQNANDDGVNPTYAGAGLQYVAVSGGQVTQANPLYDPNAEGNASASSRSAEIFKNQLYNTTGSSSYGTHGIFAMGTGVTVPPSSSAILGLSANVLSGQSGVSVDDVAFLDLGGGTEVAYAAAKNGIAKYINTSNGANNGWVAAGVISDTADDNEMKEITAEVLGGGAANIFAVDGNGNLFKITDSAPATGDLSGTLFTDYPPYIAASANNGGNSFFGGVAFAPSAVPEPSSLVLLAVGCFGCGLAAWRRRRAS